MVTLSPATLKLTEDIKRLGVSSSEVENFERCETVTNLIIDDVLNMFTDTQMVEDIKWLQEAHRGPNQMRWENIIELTENLFIEAGGAERVNGYQMLEQPCKEVSDEELASIEEVEIRETINKIKHIHEATLKRMTWLVEQCYYK